MDNKGSSVLRIVAGFYVISLAYKLITAVMRGETDANSTVLVVAAIIFIILGGFILFLGLRGMKKQSEEPEDSEVEYDDSWDIVEEVETTESDNTVEAIEETETADE